MKLTKQFLIDVCEECISRHFNNVENSCDVVSNEVAVSLENEFQVEVFSPVKVFVNGKKHFVCIVSGKYCSFSDNPVVVDPTISQFSEELENIEEVEINELGSKKVENIYDRVDF